MSSRRNFIKTGVLLGFAPTVAGEKPTSGSLAAASTPRLLKPKRIEKGQVVGLIAPASSTWEDESIEYAEDIIRSLGFRVKRGKHLFNRLGYLAGSDRERAEDLNTMFSDPEVDIVFALRGGYGTPRILPFVNYDLIARNPKVLIGYSDLTALLMAVYSRTGLVTFHGPIAKQGFSPYTLSEFKKVLGEEKPGHVIGSPPPFVEREGQAELANRLSEIVPGKARGRLIGGNLSLVTKLLGTPFEPDFRDKILFLEEVAEEPYRIDGMLTHLWLTGKLHQLKGVVFGKCTDCEPEGNARSLSVEEVLRDRFVPLGVPTLRGLMIGHVRDQTTVPLGIMAELDVNAGTLTLLESAVS